MKKPRPVKAHHYRVLAIGDDSVFNTYSAISDDAAHEMVVGDVGEVIPEGVGFIVQRFEPGKYGGWIGTWFCGNGIE